MNLPSVIILLIYAAACTTGSQAVLSWSTSFHLSTLDLKGINDLVAGLVIPLGTIDTSFALPFNDKLRVKLIEPKCSGARFGGVLLDTSFHQNDEKLVVGLKLADVGFECNVPRYEILHTFGSLRGSAIATSAASSVDFAVSIDLGDEAAEAEVLSCGLDADISLEFAETQIDFLLNEVQDDILDTVKQDVQSAVCNEVGSLTSSLLASSLTNFTAALSRYAMLELPGKVEGVYSLERNESLRLVDMQESGFFKLVLSTLHDMLSTKDESGRLAVVNLLNDMLDENNTFVFSLPEDGVVLFAMQDILNVRLFLTEIAVKGLDSIREFTLLQPLSPHVLESALSLQTLEIIGNFSLQMGKDSNFPLHSDFQVDFQIDALDVNFGVILAIVRSLGWNLQLGPLINNPLACASSTLANLSVTDFLLQVGGIRYPTITGFVSEEVSALFSHMIHTATGLFDKRIISALPGLAYAKIPAQLNEAFISQLSDDVCPEVSEQPHDYVNFSSDSYFATVVDLVNNNLLQNVNEEFIDGFTREQSGVAGMYLLVPEKVVSTATVDPFGRFSIEVDNVSLTGLNSVHGISFLEVLSGDFYPFGLRTAVSLGTAENPFEFTAAIKLVLNGSNVMLNDDFVFRFRFEEFTLALDTLALIDKFKMASLRIEELLNLDCLISTLAYGGIVGFVLRFGNASVELECRKCTTPGLQNMAVQTALPSSQVDFTDKMNHWLDVLTSKVIKELSPEHVLRKLETYQAKCHSPHIVQAHHVVDHAHHSSSSDIDVMSLVGVLAASMLLGTFFSCLLALRRPKLDRKVRGVNRKVAVDKDDVQADTIDPRPRQRKVLFAGLITRSRPKQQSIDIYIGNSVEEEVSSLGQDSRVPLVVRFLIPVVLSINIALFVGGHIIVAASVSVDFSLLGANLSLDDFASFSLIESLKDMWKAGVYAIAIFLGLLSGAWPYMKVLSLFYLWIVPPSRLSLEKRGSKLATLDLLGKWSLIDVFVLLLFMVAFNVKIENPNLEVLPVNFYTIVVRVKPIWGLYSFSLGAVVALLTNNICLYYHRKVMSIRRIEKAKRAGNAGEIVIYERLYQHVFQLNSGHKAVVSRIGVWLVGLLLPATLAVLCAGMFVPCFDFTVRGLVGMFMDIDEMTSKKQYSLWNLFVAIVIQAATAKEHVGYFYLSLSSMFSAMVIPVLQIIGLSWMWFVPLSLEGQRRIFLINELLVSWAGLEVLMVGIIVAVLEIGSISKYLLMAACEPLLPGIDNVLVPLGLVDTKDANCFYVDATFEMGSVLLAATSLQINFLSQVVNRCAEAAIEQRESESGPSPRSPRRRKKTPSRKMRLLHWLRLIRIVHEELEENQLSTKIAGLEQLQADINLQ